MEKTNWKGSLLFFLQWGPYNKGWETLIKKKRLLYCSIRFIVKLRKKQYLFLIDLAKNKPKILSLMTLVHFSQLLKNTVAFKRKVSDEIEILAKVLKKYSLENLGVLDVYTYKKFISKDTQMLNLKTWTRLMKFF